MVSRRSQQPSAEASYCAPARYERFLRSGTCLEDAELSRLASAYSRAHPDDAIPKGADKHAELARRLGSREYDWLAQKWSAGHARELQGAFRPAMPRTWLANERQWLSTDDIEAVMQQYEARYPDFKFLGVFPIDFDVRTFFGRCISEEMCRLSVHRLAAGRRSQFGAVVNLDRHDQEGSHWVAVYGNADARNRNYGVHYYDSVGRTPPPEMARFMQRVAAQVAQHSGRAVEGVPVSHNSHQHQFKNTECGIFAMFFLVCCMSGKLDVRDVWRVMGDDDVIHRLRRVFFRPPPGARGSPRR